MNETNGNAALYFVDRHAGGAADKAAFLEGERALSYRQLAEQSGRLAGLYEAHGLQPEDRAAMIVLDTIEFPIIFWGSLKAGIVPAPLNTLLTPENYEAILNDSKAKALFVSKELLGGIEPIIARRRSLKAVFVVGESAHRHLSFENELAKRAPAPALDVPADQCAFWLYSSGSTGRPKGVRHVHSSLKATADTYAAQVLGIRADDVVFSAAKLFFAYGLGNAMSFPMSVGATSVLLPERPTPEAVFRVFKQHQPTVFFGVPTLYASMLAHPGATREASSERLRLCVSAGEALPAEVGKAFAARFGVDILDGVGSTEMLHQYVCNSPTALKYGTSGKPVPGYEVRLVDEHGRDVPDGEVGEMLVKGPSAAEGYWNQREKSRATFEGGWTRSGDKYTRDAEGFYTYQGRTDDMFKVSGIWVSPFEVESALVGHEAVLEAAVVPKQDADGLLKPKAFIVLKPGKTAANGLDEELKEQVKTKAGVWKYPRWIAFVDGLPKTATGKIQRFKLREM
ncbi:MAG TPA: benzoate-CoA ligase family protein [Hyphomicrobiaceae bacterium]|nr:benzoate-CoA ligase family protein [Hyphomicrobiaceae bacterium]